jgi:hypothetical protein
VTHIELLLRGVVAATIAFTLNWPVMSKHVARDGETGVVAGSTGDQTVVTGMSLRDLRRLA